MKNILVADDEFDILETIVDSLEIEFDRDVLKIHQAQNGVEALELFKDGSGFDLVVTDLNMPKMDGLELVKNIMKITPGFPVIVFTGHGDYQELEELTSLGVKAMVKKPYIEDLINEASKCIS